MPTVKSFCSVVTGAGFDLALKAIDEKTNGIESDNILAIQDKVHMLGQVPILTRIVIYQER